MTNSPKRNVGPVALGLVLLLAGSADAQHLGDIALGLAGPAEAPEIATGVWDPATGMMTPARAFGGLFGDTGFAGFTANPGFDAPSGTFATGTRIGFDALAGVQRFDGDGLVPSTGTWVEVSFLTLSTVIEDEATPGFDLAVSSSGGFHRHFNFMLGDASGGLPAPGVYVLELSIYSTDPMVAASEPFWIAFGHEVPLAEVETATEWIEANLDPPTCPGDLDGDGAVGGDDLTSLLAGWGGPQPDLDGDGVVGGSDLAIQLSNWGESCQP